MTAILTQKEYAQFKRKVNILAINGFVLEHKVAGANKRKVKITLLKEYDFDELDRLSEGVLQ